MRTSSPLDVIGGRKFAAFLIATLAGVLTHTLSSKGLTAEVTALLIGLVGTFTASNAFVTAKTGEGGAVAPEAAESEPEQPAPAPAATASEPILPAIEQLSVAQANTNKLLAILLNRLGAG